MAFLQRLFHRSDTLPLVWRLWQDWIKPHRATLALVLLLIGVVAGSTGLYPVLIGKAYDAFAARDADAIFLAPFFVIAVTSVKGMALYAQTILTNRVVTRIEADMQSALYAKLIDADLAQVGRESPAALTQRFTTDFTYIKEALTRLSTVFLREIATIIALVGAMLWIDPVMTLVAAIIAPFAARPVARIGQKLRRVSTSTQERVGAMAGLVSETLNGARLAKTYGLEGYLKTKTWDLFDEIRRLKMKAANARARLDPLLEIGGGLAVAAVLVLIGWRIVNGESSVGDFTGFVTALLLAAQPVRALGNLHAIIQEALAALKRYFAICDEQPLIQDKPDARPLNIQKGAISFNRVCFSYHNQAVALSDITLDIPPSKMVALVGRSGSGKSTLLSLLPRLYEATGGSVHIDNQNIQDVTLASLRDAIAVVAQDAILFDDTIAANIAFGRGSASLEDITNAAKAAAAHDFIEGLPQGYQTRVGPGSVSLSGGERQRIALARAFLKNAPILLLDEATSALDAESEQLIQTALRRLMKGRTTLVIAHRLSTIRDADMIVVMDKGTIVETGTHDSLLQQQGLYAKLHEIQFAGLVTPTLQTSVLHPFLPLHLQRQAP